MRPLTTIRSSTLVTLLASITLLLFGSLALAYNGSSYNTVKYIVFKEAYSSLPHYQVDKSLFGKSGTSVDNALFQAAKRTLSISDDFFDFPHKQKLLQANGICFAGQWIIDTPSPYTGQFSYPTQSMVIARASVALSGTKQSDKRAFGIAIKLFPKKDPNAISPTLNAFVMNSMGGVVSKYVLNLAMDNEPPLGKLPSITQITTALRLRKDLQTADKAISRTTPNFSYRPVTHLAEYDSEQAVFSPTWIRLQADDSLPRINQTDFRNELRVEHYPQHTITWWIEVASDKGNKKSEAQWLRIGRLIVNESITSPACDQRLHFAHPTLR